MALLTRTAEAVAVAHARGIVHRDLEPRAAEQASRSGDGDAAAARARLGLACGGPESLRGPLLGTLCEATTLTWAPEAFEAAIPYAEEVMRISPSGSVPWAQGVSAKIVGTFIGGRIGECLSTIQVLRETEPAPEAAGTLAYAFLVGISMLDVIGQIQEGNAAMDRLTVVVDALGGREPLALLWWNTIATARGAYANDDPWRALTCANAAVEVARAINHDHLLNGNRMYQGLNLWYLGVPGEAEQILDRLGMLDATMGTVSAGRRFGLAWLRAERGALDEARLTATDLRDFGQQRHLPLDEGRGRWALAEVLRRAGDTDAAEREIQAALGMMRMVSPLDLPGALATLANLRLAQGRAEEARAATEEAISRHEAMGGACWMFRGAFVRLAHAEALHAVSAGDAARAAIAGARARLLAISATIDSPEYRKSFLESVPEDARTFSLAREWLGEARLGAR